MYKYILKRILAMAITMFLIITLSFLMIKMLPQNAFRNPETPKELQQKLEDKLHLNEPVFVQYFYYMSDIITKFDFGISYKLRPSVPVFQVIIAKIPLSMLLNIFSLFISLPLGVIFGTIAALSRNKLPDHLLSLLVIIFISVPSFVFASLLQYTLTYIWPIFPTLYDVSAANFPSMMFSLTLPIIALSLNPIATLTRYLRGELTENLNSEYLLLARVKGLTRAQATVRHAFRNSLVPLMNMLIFMFASILGGSLVIEGIFGIPGMGSTLIDSTKANDHFLTLALLIFYSLISVVTELIVDISYGLVDPRIRIGGGK
jgi:ABC-type dipeptide/oligopeptide/nickel transport systems, permease components